MQDINAWLQSDQDYNTGLALYTKYGKSDFLKKLFADGPTPFNKPKLEAELQKLAPAQPAKVPEIPENPKIPALEKTELSESVKRNQPELSESEEKKQKIENHKLYLQLQEDNKTKYRQLERNMTMLDFSKEQPILHQTAKQILGIHKRIQENYKMLDYYAEFDRFPFQQKKVPITDEAQLIYQSISKARTRLDSGKCKNIEKTKLLIQTKLSRLAEINGKAEDE